MTWGKGKSIKHQEPQEVKFRGGWMLFSNMFLATTLFSRRDYCNICRNCVGVVGTTVETVVETVVFL